MAKQLPDKFGYVFTKVYKHEGVQFQYQGVCRDGRLRFSNLNTGLTHKMEPQLAKEYFNHD